MQIEETKQTKMFRVIKKLKGWKTDQIALWPIEKLEKYCTKLQELEDSGNNKS